MLQRGGILTKKQAKEFLTIEKTHQVEDRIVSIHQDFVRPIVRGKVIALVEFGAKVSISIVDGYSYIERLSWDAYNEGTTLIDSIEAYKQKTGTYPKRY